MAGGGASWCHFSFGLSPRFQWLFSMREMAEAMDSTRKSVFFLLVRVRFDAFRCMGGVFSRGSENAVQVKSHRLLQALRLKIYQAVTRNYFISTLLNVT